jgi:hypothetical protein
MTTREQAIEAAALLVDGDYPMSSVIEIFNYLESLGLLKWPTEESAARKLSDDDIASLDNALRASSEYVGPIQHSPVSVNAALLDVVKQIEWAGVSLATLEPACPMCEGLYADKRHKPSCELASAIAAAEREKEG